MRNVQRMCAPVDLPFEDWDQIPWRRYEKTIRKLQFRIAKAFREKKFGLVNRLQKLLTRSLAARALAVRKVTSNPGKNTPGVDQEIWRTAKQKRTALKMLKRRGYRALPLRRVYIPKKNVRREKSLQ